MDSLPVEQSEPIDGEIVVGRLRVSPQEISAFVDDREIQLTFKEFNLLVILARNHGRVVTRETVEAETLIKRHRTDFLTASTKSELR